LVENKEKTKRFIKLFSYPVGMNEVQRTLRTLLFSHLFGNIFIKIGDEKKIKKIWVNNFKPFIPILYSDDRKGMEVALDKFVKQKIEGINLLELKEEISEEIKNELIELWENKNDNDDGGYKELKQLFVKHNGARYNVLILFPLKREGVLYGVEKRISPLTYIG